MTISRVVVVVWCLCAVPFIPSTVSAANERIVFSGAIIEPTCSIPAAESTRVGAAASGVESQARRLACAKLSHAAVGTVQVYALTAVRLSSAVSDGVLKYFDAYVKASRPDAADPVLLTQTYQ